MPKKVKHSLLDDLRGEVRLSTPYEIAQRVMQLQVLERNVKEGNFCVDAEALSGVMDIVALFVHDIVILRRDADLPLEYDHDKLSDEWERITSDIEKVLQDKDFQDTNKKVETTDFGVSQNKKKEIN